MSAMDEEFVHSASDSAEDPAPWAKMRSIVEDSKFQMLVACVILLNTIAMAIQTDFPHWYEPADCNVQNVTLAAPAIRPEAASCWNMWHVTNGCFLAFFLVELSLRFAAYGCRGFFCSKEDWVWNLFDFTIVILAAADFARKLITSSGGGTQLLTVLRTLRILRILRVLRLFKELKKLNLLIRGLLSSFDNVFWIMLLLGFIIFIGAIFCTQIIGNSDSWEKGPEDVKKHIEEWWGSVGKSSLTLFQILTLDDWARITNTVEIEMPWMVIFFVAFVVFGSFVILSLLTGVMADHMNAVREAAEAEEHTLKGDDFRQELEKMHGTFNEDGDAKHHLNRSHFKELMQSPDVHRILRECDVQIDPSEVELVYDCMDTEEKGHITWEQFSRGLAEIRERELRPKHIMELHGVVNLAMREVERRQGSMHKSLDAPTHKCDADLTAAEARMDRLEEYVNAMEMKIKKAMEVI